MYKNYYHLLFLVHGTITQIIISEQTAQIVVVLGTVTNVVIGQSQQKRDSNWKLYCFELLGQCALGNIYKAMNDKTKQAVAVKVLNFKKVSQESNQNVQNVKQSKRRSYQTQSYYMIKCNSPNIVKCYDVYQNKDLKIMMIEYCNGGNLANEIGLKKRIPEDEAIMILKQIINGIKELHSKKIIHRYLKAQNIFSHNGDYKIANFGFSKQLNNEDNLAIGTCLGTTTTIAPQVYSERPYNLKADIWSIGVIFFYMIFGQHPFKAVNAKQLEKQAEIMQEKLKTLTEFNGVKPSPKVIKFFQQVLTRDISKRLGWKQLDEHQIFKRDERDHLPLNFRKNVELNKNKQLNQDQSKLINQKEKEYDYKDVQKAEESNEQIKIKVCVLNPSLIQAKKKEINKFESQKYLWVEEAHLQCLKTEFIYKEIILPIESENILDLTHKNREEVQMMYLLCTRCFNNMVVINDQYEKLKKIDSVRNLHELIKGLHQDILQIWTKYGKLLTQIQNKVTSIILDYWRYYFKGKFLQNQNRFLAGVEGIQHSNASKIFDENDKKNEILCDYTREQQIQFTLKYIQKNLKKFKIKGKIQIKVRNNLYHYKDINKIELQDLRRQNLDFKQYIKKMIAL